MPIFLVNLHLLQTHEGSAERLRLPASRSARVLLQTHEGSAESRCRSGVSTAGRFKPTRVRLKVRGCSAESFKPTRVRLKVVVRRDLKWERFKPTRGSAESHRTGSPTSFAASKPTRGSAESSFKPTRVRLKRHDEGSAERPRRLKGLGLQTHEGSAESAELATEDKLLQTHEGFG